MWCRKYYHPGDDVAEHHKTMGKISFNCINRLRLNSMYSFYRLIFYFCLYRESTNNRTWTVSFLYSAQKSHDYSSHAESSLALTKPSSAKPSISSLLYKPCAAPRVSPRVRCRNRVHDARLATHTYTHTSRYEKARIERVSYLPIPISIYLQLAPSPDANAKNQTAAMFRNSHVCLFAAHKLAPCMCRIGNACLRACSKESGAALSTSPPIICPPARGARGDRGRFHAYSRERLRPPYLLIDGKREVYFGLASTCLGTSIAAIPFFFTSFLENHFVVHRWKFFIVVQWALYLVELEVKVIITVISRQLGLLLWNEWIFTITVGIPLMK